MSRFLSNPAPRVRALLALLLVLPTPLLASEGGEIASTTDPVSQTIVGVLKSTGSFGWTMGHMLERTKGHPLATAPPPSSATTRTS